MNQQKYVSGKKVPSRNIKEGDSLPQTLKKLVSLLEEVDRIPGNNSPSNPHSWYGDKSLYKREFDDRYQKLKLQKPSKEDLLKRVIEMEMVVEYENYFNYLLIKPYIASREAIFQADKIATQSARKRLEGKSKVFDPQRQSAISVINQIQKTGQRLHQNDYGTYLIKLNKVNPRLAKSTARKYWLEETGFKSTKKLTLLKS
jgi:hypothetical protein